VVPGLTAVPDAGLSVDDPQTRTRYGPWPVPTRPADGDRAGAPCACRSKRRPRAVPRCPSLPNRAIWTHRPT